jgi:hypothetical protein
MKFLVALVLVMLLAVPVFGLGDNENNNELRNTNTNMDIISNAVNSINTNRSESRSDSSSRSESDSRSTAIQGQMQGQASIQDQGNTQNMDASKGDTKVFANQWPGINGEQGTNNFNGYSIFGGVGISATAEYRMCIEKLANIKMMESCGYFSKEEAISQAKEAWAQFLYTTKDKRFLGVLWKTTGRNLLNGFGLLAWDSFWTGGEFKKVAPRQGLTPDSGVGTLGVSENYTHK